MPDACEMCDGLMEIDASVIERLGHVGCPLCIAREKDQRIADLIAEIALLRSALSRTEPKE
ncbi:MAG: hypothetical protein AB1781_11045 [Pseudomonadota bacterium]